MHSRNLKRFGNTYISEFRGTFLVDNFGNLQTRIPRGENLRFIMNYLHVNPCAKLGACRRALMLWRGIKICADSRGHYNSYFYDRYANKWYHDKLWTKIIDSQGKKRALLTPLGMTYVDNAFAKKIKLFVELGDERIRLKVKPGIEASLFVGEKYSEVISRKTKCLRQIS